MILFNLFCYGLEIRLPVAVQIERCWIACAGKAWRDSIQSGVFARH